MTWYVVDGMDGCGKTTVSTILKQNLESKGRKVLEITHPNENTFFGRQAAKFLCIQNKGAELVSTVFYILDVLCSLVKKKKIGKNYDDVIFVRYSLAAAYLPEKLVKFGYDVIIHVLPVPDVKIFVDSRPKICMDRIILRGEKLEVFETEEKLEKTRRKMKMIAEDWNTIDNAGAIEETETAVKKLLADN